ncbi:TPA: glycosyltransferase family 52 [Streptococcus suis]
MDDLISVIVPVYNVERYLPQCLESILNQSYKQIEVLVINDASTDNSRQICEKYAKTDSRIKLIHKTENSGVSEARNLGLENCNGKYITFINSDDYVEPRFLEEALAKMIEYDSDFLVSSYYRIIEETGEFLLYPYFPEEKILSQKETLDKIYLSTDNTLQKIWGILWKRSLFFDNFKVQFPSGRTGADTTVISQLVMKSQKIVFINKPWYCYRERATSPTALQSTSDKVEDWLDAFEKNILNAYASGYSSTYMNYSFVIQLNHHKKQLEHSGETNSNIYHKLLKYQHLLSKKNTQKLPIKNLYFCHTLYHLFITLCKLNPEEEYCISLNEVLQLDPKVKEKLIKKYSINVIEEKQVALFNYDAIYIFNDWESVGPVLRDKGIYYNLIEDGYDYFTYYTKETLFSDPENIQFDLASWGYSKFCKTIEVNDISKIKEDCRREKFIELPRKQLIGNIGKQKREMLLDVFNIQQNTSKRRKLLILTQPLCFDKLEDSITTDKEQVDYYQNIVNQYRDEGFEIYLKIHPRDKVDYTALTGQVIFLEKNVPMEIYEMLGSYHFEIGITHSSTGLDYLSCVTEKIFLKNLREHL